METSYNFINYVIKRRRKLSKGFNCKSVSSDERLHSENWDSVGARI